MDVELLTVFNAVINLRDNLEVRPHILTGELNFLSFATRMAPYSNAQLLQDLVELDGSSDPTRLELRKCQ